ncbi:MAG: PqqD family protein [Proteobacteria bacterium]|nr:PqqD family protein [Pseudomonadota bacterium]
MARVRKTGDWLSAQVGDGLVMMSPEQGNYLGISGVGTRIWELLDTTDDVEAICDALREEYAVSPDQCRADVDAFLAKLDAQGAITYLTGASD